MGWLGGYSPIGCLYVPLNLAYSELILTLDSANVRRMVVNTAMLANLKFPPEPFGDVIRTHFRLKARSIRQLLDRWLAQDDGKQTSVDGGGYGSPLGKKNEGEESAGGSVSAFSRDVAEMKELLERLEEESL